MRTLIVGADSITEGKSYYLAEVLAALERLQAVSEDGKHLVLVDELFRGTNTEERIGAGKAYLEALVRRGALTLAASHDRELGSLLGETFRPVHFTERVSTGQEIVFDYIAPRRAVPHAQRHPRAGDRGLLGRARRRGTAGRAVAHRGAAPGERRPARRVRLGGCAAAPAPRR